MGSMGTDKILVRDNLSKFSLMGGFPHSPTSSRNPATHDIETSTVMAGKASELKF